MAEACRVACGDNGAGGNDGRGDALCRASNDPRIIKRIAARGTRISFFCQRQVHSRCRIARARAGFTRRGGF